ncbi:MAG: amino acid ABC transporter permease [Candidatus Ancillula sp.]|jgi:polar amino acid transport system substrate-binding protein|nr:amino acid ABC transporter permease [Candidatus Ancillula sp.]
MYKNNLFAVDETTIPGLIAANYDRLLAGFLTTIELALVSFLFALAIGAVLGTISSGNNKIINAVVSAYVGLIRGVPLMVLVFFIYYGIPGVIGEPLDDFFAGCLALTLNCSAYLTVIVRSGIHAVPKTQLEASHALGLSYTSLMWRIILPQAVKIMMPNFINQFVISLKDTTILSIIGVLDLMQVGKIIIARNMQSFNVYIIIGIMYLVVILALTKLASLLQKRLK